MQFSDFKIDPALLSNIEKLNFSTPTEIQEKVIPIAVEGNDIAGIAKTGTGKTAAFLIPVIQRLIGNKNKALCLAPTRELATQIENQAINLIGDLEIKTANLIGGMPLKKQIQTLRDGAQVIIGTPGRILDVVRDKHLNLEDINVLVFDEADRMFDMGFIQDMRYIFKKVNPSRQILLFSATMNFSVQNLAFEYGGNPIEFNLSRDTLTAEGIQQQVLFVSDREKAAVLVGLCRKHLAEKNGLIVFVNYKDKVDWVASLLEANGYSAKGLSSLLRQDQRSRILSSFREGKYQALVATDVASRGLDIDDVCLVINYHLPEEASNYVHRIGRTARAGRKGLAISIAGSEDAYNQMRIEELLGYKIPHEAIGDDDIPQDVVFPSRRSREDKMDGNTTSDKGDRSGNRRGGRRPNSRNKQSRDNRDNRENRDSRDNRDNRDNRDKQSRVNSGSRSASSRNDDKSNNNRRGGRRNQNNRSRQRNRSDRNDIPVKDLFPNASELPSPITGSPIIYDMKTGSAKSGPSESSLLKRFGSRVGSIFGTKKP